MADQADQLPSLADRLAPIVGAALIAALLCAFGLALWASPAAANDRFNIDPDAQTGGHLIEDAAGNAYIGWVDSANGGTPMFCKVPAGGTCTHPIALPIPGAAGHNIPDQVLPVLGAGSTVYAVGPGYIDDSVVIWTSTNGGESFESPATVNTTSYPSMGSPNTALLRGSEFLIATSHVGAGLGVIPTDGIGGGKLSFAGPGVYAGEATLGLTPAGNPVEAYYEDVDGSPIQYYSYKGAGSLTDEADWTGPTLVSAGQTPRVTGGAGGLFLLSADDTASGEPEAIDVRKFSGTSFGSPVTLYVGPTYGLDGLSGGAIGETPGGHVAVVWPVSSGGERTMRLWISTDGGLSFSSVGSIAHLGSEYESGVNAEVTLSEAGTGWLTYLDEEGLQVADLAPLPQSSPGTSSPAAGKTTPTKPPTPKPYAGATQTFTTAVGGELLTLKVPKACLLAEQPFYVGVGKEKRHGIAKKLHTPIKVTKITFSFDGLKKTLKKKPFRWLIKPPALAPGHPYVVKARVTVTVQKNGGPKTVVKTLKGQVSIC